MLALRVGQGQAQEADEGDNRGGTLYDSFHGVSVRKQANGLATICRFRPGTPFRPSRQREKTAGPMNRRSDCGDNRTKETPESRQSLQSSQSLEQERAGPSGYGLLRPN